jgi:hypothetical protein
LRMQRLCLAVACTCTCTVSDAQVWCCFHKPAFTGSVSDQWPRSRRLHSGRLGSYRELPSSSARREAQCLTAGTGRTRRKRHLKNARCCLFELLARGCGRHGRRCSSHSLGGPPSHSRPGRATGRLALRCSHTALDTALRKATDNEGRLQSLSVEHTAAGARGPLCGGERA